MTEKMGGFPGPDPWIPQDGGEPAWVNERRLREQTSEKTPTTVFTDPEGSVLVLPKSPEDSQVAETIVEG